MRFGGARIDVNPHLSSYTSGPRMTRRLHKYVCRLVSEKLSSSHRQCVFGCFFTCVKSIHPVWFSVFPPSVFPPPVRMVLRIGVLSTLGPWTPNSSRPNGLYERKCMLLPPFIGSAWSLVRHLALSLIIKIFSYLARSSTPCKLIGVHNILSCLVLQRSDFLWELSGDISGAFCRESV